jgi:predicted nuclease of predicted toxin-antitoxin system
MKVLIDMNLSPNLAGFLKSAGVEALHWSEVGLAYAPDSDLTIWAPEHGFIVLTNDLPFGIALATANTEKPSVVQICGDDLRPASIGNQVIRRCGRFRQNWQKELWSRLIPSEPGSGFCRFERTSRGRPC